MEADRKCKKQTIIKIKNSGKAQLTLGFYQQVKGYLPIRLSSCRELVSPDRVSPRFP